MMTRTSLLSIALSSLWLAAELLAQQPAGEEGRSSFRTFDIFVDSGSTPLAAYQVEFGATNGVATIVGIEGGEHQAFREPPFYDPKAMQLDRVIIAAFNTSPAASLPSGRTRVATIHVNSDTHQPPEFSLKLQAAANPQNIRIPAEVSFAERKQP